MPDQEPGDRNPVTAGSRARRLATPPSARYAARDAPTAGTTPGASGASGAARSALPGPLLRAGLVALAGALALVAVGGVLASTFGLLLLSGAAGSTIGLVLARAAVPVGEARATPRPSVVRLAVALALAMILLGDLGLWLFARQEGGSLGLLDYLWTTFGPFVPGDALVAAMTAWWGANAGPVQR